MGYTHYWNHTPRCEDDVWKTVRIIVKQIFDITHVPLQYEYDSPKPPVVDGMGIRFNGVEDDGHETFFFDKEDSGFNFCKTACKPYDEVVVAVLITLARHYPGFAWTSDGDYEDFKAGGLLYEQASGLTLPPYNEED